MSLTEILIKQGSKPFGFWGPTIGKLMNLFHVKKYLRGLETLEIEKSWICLDIGCGGGKPASKLAEMVPRGKVYGLDHSPEMVALSESANRDMVAEGKMQFALGSVSEIPFEDDKFDLITASETIQFWPSLENDLKEVKRVLKPEGIFLIMNRLPEPDDKHWHERVQIKNPDDYKERLSAAGFGDVVVDTSLHKGWILVRA